MSQLWRSVNISGNLHFKISAVFSENALDLTILERETAWSTHVPEMELRVQATNLNSNFTEYYEDLKKYLNQSPENVEFTFESGKFMVNLKLFNKMNILYFQALLNEDRFMDCVFGIIDTIYNKNVEYSIELTHKKDEYESIKNANEVLEKKLNECLDRRKAEELKLYNNFLTILNEKKRQIQHLNDLLIAFRQGRPTVNHPVQSKRKVFNQRPGKMNKKHNKPDPEPSSESEANSSNENYNTDDEPGNNNGTSNKPNKSFVHAINDYKLSAPSTSKEPDEFLPELPSDSPTQPFVFPRRIRSENNLISGNASNNKVTPVINKNEEYPRNIQDTVKEKTLPQVNFDTQDMLDNLP